MQPCPLHVEQDEYEAFVKCEAVVVREYEGQDGSRTARVVAWGDFDEMRTQADSMGMLVVVPVGFHVIGQRAIPVSELISPKEEDHAIP